MSANYYQGNNDYQNKKKNSHKNPIDRFNEDGYEKDRNTDEDVENNDNERNQ